MKCKEKQIQNRFLKLRISLFLLFFCLTLSLPWKYWPNLVCKYWPLLNVFFYKTFSLLHVRMNPSSYKLLGMFALYAGCWQCSNTLIHSYTDCFLTMLVIMGAWSRFHDEITPVLRRKRKKNPLSHPNSIAKTVAS